MVQGAWVGGGGERSARGACPGSGGEWTGYGNRGEGEWGWMDGKGRRGAAVFHAGGGRTERGLGRWGRAEGKEEEWEGGERACRVP
eukprot:365706-Chlamydomonas_euryale.AAC.12